MNVGIVYIVPAAVWALALGAGAAETPVVDTATAFLLDHDERVREVVLAQPEDSLSTEDRSRVQALINEAFDFQELARLSLGEHWPQRSAEEQTEFVSVFSGIIEKQNFDIFVRYHREGKITYTTEEVDAETGRAIVHAEVPLKQETKQIAYYLHRPATEGPWRIYDLAIDGAGTADANRRIYTRYIGRHSYPKLLETLRKKLDRLEGQG
jgi:phospholipid transport system substrate-binding protein